MKPDDLTVFPDLSWFSIYLADSLAQAYGSGPEGRLFRWLILHMAHQASNGHIRTDLDCLEAEMRDWYTLTEARGGDIDDHLPAELTAGLPGLLDAAADRGLLVRLGDENTAVDSLPPPRPPLALSADGRHIYFLKRRRAEDVFLDRLSRRTAPGRRDLFPLPGHLPGGAAGVLMRFLAGGKRFLILSGGPGTGKTTTVAALMELIRAGCREAGTPLPGIVLTAPTGRAAARLGEALGGGDTGRTLHSLLGMSPDRPPKHNREDPLPADLVIVDEASMVDLPTMNLLLDALAPDTALLLVGDPDQLPSVEAGALLGDLLAGAEEAASGSGDGPLAGSVLHLTKVYRSSAGILDTAAAVRAGDAAALEASFREDGVRIRHPDTPEKTAAELAESYRAAVSASRDATDARKSVPELFPIYGDHSVLSPLRRGPWGTESLNRRISQILSGGGGPFPGMPVMVTGNDRSRNLWNGDRGVLLENEGRLRAFFPDAADEAGCREFPLAALPGWEPAWVQTIHKSQGSEYDRVTILLPLGARRLLSREILYTALTRAKSTAELIADPQAVSAALERKVSRNSRIRRWAAGSGG